MKKKVTNRANTLDLGTFGDLTAFSTDFDVCGAEESQTSKRRESHVHTHTYGGLTVTAPALLVARGISLPPGPTGTSVCQLQG